MDLNQTAAGSGLFSLTHCSMLGLIAAACILSAVFYRKSVLRRKPSVSKAEAISSLPFSAKRHPATLVIGLVLLFTDLSYYIAGLIGGWMTLYLLPLHLCTMTIYLVFIHSLFSWDWLGQVLYALCLPGAWAALAFPDWISFPLISYTAIRCYMVHGLIVVYIIMQTAAGIIRPRLSALWKPVIFLCVIVPPIMFLNRAINANYLFLAKPSPDSPLVSLWNLAGGNTVLYLVYFGILTICGMTIMYLPFAIYRKLSAKH